MAKLLQTLIPILLLLGTAATAQSQTTQFYIDFTGTPDPSLIYQGDAHFDAGTSNLRLTKTNSSGDAQTWSTGRAVYYQPFKFWESGAKPDMETTLTFTINPNSGDSNPADGLAFFIEPAGAPIGANGGSFAEFDSNGVKASAFAVEFDVFVNGGSDPDYRHIGIDIESKVSKNTTDVGDALLGQEVTARINYVGATNAITVNVAAGGKNYEVSYVYDLTTIVPQDAQVGISAATGGQVAIHDVVSWYFSSTLVAEDSYIHQVV